METITIIATVLIDLISDLGGFVAHILTDLAGGSTDLSSVEAK